MGWRGDWRSSKVCQLSPNELRGKDAGGLEYGATNKGVDDSARFTKICGVLTKPSRDMDHFLLPESDGKCIISGSLR